MQRLEKEQIKTFNENISSFVDKVGFVIFFTVTLVKPSGGIWCSGIGRCGERKIPSRMDSLERESPFGGGGFSLSALQRT